MIMHGTDIKLLYTHDCSRCGIYLVASSIYLSPQLPNRHKHGLTLGLMTVFMSDCFIVQCIVKFIA